MSDPLPGALRAGVDIGGTFTDIALIDDATGEVWLGKVLTTSDAPARAVETGLRQVFRDAGRNPGELVRLCHATTLVTNALIERRGAVTALMTTRGFRDVLEIARENRYDLHDLFIELPSPLVPRPLRYEVTERLAADGTVLVPLDEEQARSVIRSLPADVESVAICLLHGYRDPSHEQALAALVRELAPTVRVSLSSEIAPEIREYDRCSTTVANAYVQPSVERYVADLEGRLRAMSSGTENAPRLLVMLSSGGLAAPETVQRFPVRMIESGPAAGAIAAATIVRGVRGEGRDRALAFDMGGTTAKACLIEGGSPRVAADQEVARVYRFKRGSGLPIRAATVDLIEIGAGGGSIAGVSTLGLLRVGPESAGAVPGPACYGQGGDPASARPTVTDADLVLGYLNPDYFLGGRMRLDVEAARAAIVRHVAKPLGLDLTAAAWGIHQLVNEQMAAAARIHAVERGVDVRQYPLLAFGGAGPVHADRVAHILGQHEWLAPLGAGALSAWGLLVAPLRFDAARSRYESLDAADWPAINVLMSELESEALGRLADAGADVSSAEVSWEAELRYRGQGHQVTVDLPRRPFGPSDRAEIVARYEAAYRRLYHRLCPGVPVETLGFRVVAVAGALLGARGRGPGAREDRAVSQAPLLAEECSGRHGELPGRATSSPDPRPLAPGPQKRSRMAYFPELGGYVPTPVYDRYALPLSFTFDGPALVEEQESTVVVGPGSRARVLERGLIEVIREG